MTLAVHAGANLPAIWIDCLRGGDPHLVIARGGIRYRCEEGDLRHLVWQLGQRHPGAAAGVVRPHRAVVHAYFELRDPKPLGATLIDLARRSLRRMLTRHG